MNKSGKTFKSVDTDPFNKAEIKRNSPCVQKSAGLRQETDFSTSGASKLKSSNDARVMTKIYLDIHDNSIINK